MRLIVSSAACAALALCAVLTVPSVPLPARAATTAAPSAAAAPLDEYFGRMQLSPIGIGNELHLIASRSQSASDARNSLPLLTLIENSLHDWQHKYPHDDWIPENLARLEHDYLLVPTIGGRIHAMQVIQWLRSDYPGTPALDRAQREAERAMGLPTPTPEPEASASAAPEAEASAAPETEASAAPETEASASPTP